MRLAFSTLALLLALSAPGTAAQTLSFWSFDDGEIAPGGTYSGPGVSIVDAPTDDANGASDQARSFDFEMTAGGFAGFFVDKAGVEDVSGVEFLTFQLRADVPGVNLPLLFDVDLQEDVDGDGFDGIGGDDDEFGVVYEVTGPADGSGYVQVFIPLTDFTDVDIPFEGANDGFDFTRVDRIAITVNGAYPEPFTLSFDEFGFTDRFGKLTAAVTALGPGGDGTLNAGNTNALTAKLEQAARKHARGQDPSGPLGAFRNQVEALTGRKLTPAQADVLLAELDALEASIAGGATAAAAAPGGRLTAAETASSAPVPVPNPTAGRAALDFELAAPADVRLAVYDVLGREVAVLVDRALEAGQHSATFDATGLPSGTYVARFSAGTHVEAIPLTVAR